MRQSAFRLGILSGFVFGLIACASAPEHAVVAVAAEPPVVAAPLPDPVAEQQQRLQALHLQITQYLDLAEHALSRDRLMYPAEDNAYSWYQQVLALDELNADAHWGMKRITQRYLDLAEQAFEAGQYSRGEQMLNGALQIAATPAQVEAIRARYRKQLEGKVFALSPGDLQARSDSLQQQLAEIAVRAREHQSRLLIVARNDAEGRWIYKQMRDALDGHRLRGNIELGDRPRVVLIDL